MKRGLLKKKPPPLTAQAIQPQNDKMQAQLLRNENDNPSRGYKTPFASETELWAVILTPLHTAQVVHTKPRKRRVKILPGSSAQLKWRP